MVRSRYFSDIHVLDTSSWHWSAPPAPALAPSPRAGMQMALATAVSPPLLSLSLSLSFSLSLSVSVYCGCLTLSVSDSGVALSSAGGTRRRSSCSGQLTVVCATILRISLTGILTGSENATT